jgi:hypothetical protein
MAASQNTKMGFRVTFGENRRPWSGEETRRIVTERPARVS